MAVSLKKGQGVDLRKQEYDLSQVTIGLGWDVAEEKKGFFGTLFGKTEEYDLDAIAFLLGDDDKITDFGKMNGNVPTLINGDVVFFNSMRHPSGAIWLTGDNRTGAGDGDDEQIIVTLDRIPAKYQRILFLVAIYQGKEKNQNFGKIQNAFIRAVDGRDREICRYDISGGATYANYCSMTFAELVRNGTHWSFNAIGTPHETDGLLDLLINYIPR